MLQAETFGPDRSRQSIAAVTPGGYVVVTGKSLRVAYLNDDTVHITEREPAANEGAS